MCTDSSFVFPLSINLIWWPRIYMQFWSSYFPDCPRSPLFTPVSWRILLVAPTYLQEQPSWHDQLYSPLHRLLNPLYTDSSNLQRKSAFQKLFAHCWGWKDDGRGWGLWLRELCSWLGPELWKRRTEGKGQNADLSLSLSSPGLSQDPRSDTTIPCLCRFVSLQVYWSQFFLRDLYNLQVVSCNRYY